MQPGSDTILWDVHSPLSLNTCKIYLYISINSFKICRWEAGENKFYFYFENVVILKEQTLFFGFILSCLRDHTLWLLGLTSLRPII